MRLINFRAAASLVAGILTVFAPFQSAFSFDYPEKAVTIVVPYAPGGGTDFVVRLVANKMSGELGRTFVVENRPGAGTNIGMGYVARAEPDGYTLLAASNTLTTNKSLYSSLNFDPTSDFISVGLIAEAPLVIVVQKDSPYKTLNQLVEFGQQHPGELTFGTAGMGSSGHIAGELLMQAADFKALHVPYKGGAPAITDLLGGRISFMPINPLEVISHIKAGSLRALAVMNKKGTPLLPDLETVDKLGFQELEATVWWGIVAPKGTPEPRVTKLNAALNIALNDPGVIEGLHNLGATLLPGTASEFHSFKTRNTALMAKVIEAANISVD